MSETLNHPETVILAVADVLARNGGRSRVAMDMLVCDIADRLPRDLGIELHRLHSLHCRLYK